MAAGRSELDDLTAFVDVVTALEAALPASSHATRPSPGELALVEHVHHLADLEEEGFAVRLSRLLAEEAPQLPDFDGALIARERRYLERTVADGIARFAAARRANVERLRAVTDTQWQRAGTQEGVGRVTLGELPERMLAHDCSHAHELVALFDVLAPNAAVASRLRALALPGAPCAA
jgi:hypothetical protein